REDSMRTTRTAVAALLLPARLAALLAALLAPCAASAIDIQVLSQSYLTDIYVDETNMMTPPPYTTTTLSQKIASSTPLVRHLDGPTVRTSTRSYLVYGDASADMFSVSTLATAQVDNSHVLPTAETKLKFTVGDDVQAPMSITFGLQGVWFYSNGFVSLYDET